MIRISRILFVLFAMVFLASCHLNETIEKKTLLEPEKFMKERSESIDRTVSLGPKIKVDSELEKKIRNNERRQINKEERKNYIHVSDANNDVFPITINFENVSIQDMAVMFSEITGKNILVGDEVDGEVTAKLVNVPWDKALDSVLKTKKLAKHVDEKANIIRIHKQGVLVAQEEFDRKRIEDLQKTRDAQRAIEPIYTEIFRLYYTKATDIKSEIESVMGSGEGSGSSPTSSVPKNVKVTIDDRLNSLIIQATKSELDLIARLIKEVDVRTKQILIEAFIVEATDDFSKELGAKFGIDSTDLGNTYIDGHNFAIKGAGIGGTQSAGTASSYSSSTGLLSDNGVAGALGGIGFILATSATNLKIELTASEKDGVTKVLSNPRVFTLDNEEAVVIQGDEIPYPSSADGGGTDYEFREAGVKLTVTPSIVGDGNVILKVKVEKNSPDYSKSNTAPAINKREITTTLLVKDNTIVVIGGVFTQTTVDATNKVPFFGDLPLIGGLFSYKKDSDVRKELLIFLAPRII
jgi:type IV pilus assembly protein PilQ